MALAAAAPIASMGMWRRAMVSLAGLALVLVACSGGGSSSSQPLADTFPRLDGTTAGFADYRGTPVVVNFFSSTCEPCLTEMPALEQVHQQLGSQVRFLGMNGQDTVESGKAIVATTGVTWDIGRDPDLAILQRLGGIGLPTTYLLDRNGRVVFSHTGKLTSDDLRNALRDKKLIT
jgi:thiol-disulfide isomerase/thioredoxin